MKNELIEVGKYLGAVAIFSLYIFITMLIMQYVIYLNPTKEKLACLLYFWHLIFILCVTHRAIDVYAIDIFLLRRIMSWFGFS